MPSRASSDERLDTVDGDGADRHRSQSESSSGRARTGSFRTPEGGQGVSPLTVAQRLRRRHASSERSAGMIDKHKEILKRNREALKLDLNVEHHVMDFLFQNNIIDDEQMCEILAHNTRAKQVAALLDLLPRRGPKAFEAFLAALAQDFPWLHELLERANDELDADFLGSYYLGGKQIGCFIGPDNPENADHAGYTVIPGMPLSQDADDDKDETESARRVSVSVEKVSTVVVTRECWVQKLDYARQLSAYQSRRALQGCGEVDLLQWLEGLNRQGLNRQDTCSSSVSCASEVQVSVQWQDYKSRGMAIVQRLHEYIWIKNSSNRDALTLLIVLIALAWHPYILLILAVPFACHVLVEHISCDTAVHDKVQFTNTTSEEANSDVESFTTTAVPENVPPTSQARKLKDISPDAPQFQSFDTPDIPKFHASDCSNIYKHQAHPLAVACETNNNYFSSSTSGGADGYSKPADVDANHHAFEVDTIGQDKHSRMVHLRQNDLLFLTKCQSVSCKVVRALDMYSRLLLVPQDNLRLHGDPTGESWFYPVALSSKQAALILSRAGLPGCYIVYRPTNGGVSEYNISQYRISGKVTTYHVFRDSSGEYHLQGERTFYTIHDLVQYYRHNRGTMRLRLRRPLADAGKVAKPEDMFDKMHIIEHSMITIQTGKSGRIGNGFFGNVQKAIYNGQLVAVKMRNSVHYSKEWELDDFYEEGRISCKLSHANIVALLGVTNSLKDAMLVFEYCPGGDLRRALKEGFIDLKDLRRMIKLCTQALSAIYYLHQSQHIIHRDIAARNCLLNKRLDTLKLCDFGLARCVVDDEYHAEVWEKIAVRWASPEVLSHLRFSSWSDIWSVGVMFWEMFSGGLIPHAGLGNSCVTQAIISGERRLERPSACPSHVFHLIRKCWVREPTKRLPADVLRDLLNATPSGEDVNDPMLLAPSKVRDRLTESAPSDLDCDVDHDTVTSRARRRRMSLKDRNFALVLSQWRRRSRGQRVTPIATPTEDEGEEEFDAPPTVTDADSTLRKRRFSGEAIAPPNSPRQLSGEKEIAADNGSARQQSDDKDKPLSFVEARRLSGDKDSPRNISSARRLSGEKLRTLRLQQLKPIMGSPTVDGREVATFPRQSSAPTVRGGNPPSPPTHLPLHAVNSDSLISPDK